MFPIACTLTSLVFVAVGDCGRYRAPRGSQVDFPYRRVPTIRELVEDAGYRYDRYNVTTDDGHILALHRMSPPDGDRPRGVPVLVINGYAFHSDGWFLLGNASLPVVLSGLGYDVWLGDVRGSARSLSHVKYEPDDYRAYNYSIHELGVYDLPAFIDQILGITEKRQLLYVGMSLSCGMLFVMNSERPEYNDKVLGAALMAPAGNLLKNDENDLLYRYNTFHQSHLINGALRMNHWLYPSVDYLPTLKHLITQCSSPIFYLPCKIFLIISIGFSDSSDSDGLFYQIATGISTLHMNIAKHLTQIIALGRFCKYDYGFEKNMEIYGTEYPPNYNLSKTTAPVFLIHGGRDMQVRPQAARRTGRQLGNLSKRKLIPSFNHGDFQIGTNAPKMVYEDIVDFFDGLTRNDFTSRNT